MPRKPRKKPAVEPAAPLALHSLVCVRWLDASFELDHEPDLMTLDTVGWLIKQDSSKIIVAGEADAARRYFRGYTCIPAGWILDIRCLD